MMDTEVSYIEFFLKEKKSRQQTFSESQRRSKMPALRDAAAAVCTSAAVVLEEL